MSHPLSPVMAGSSPGSTLALLNQLFPPPRGFTVRLWEGTELGAAGPPPFTLVLKQPGAARRMFLPPLELSLGEAFIHGDFDVEGDIFAAVSMIDELSQRSLLLAELARLAREFLLLPGGGPNRSGGRGPARLSGALHSRERDRAAVQYHYDVGNDFYRLWLDRQMQYSCAYFGTGAEDLDSAQERKLEHICRKLRLRPGERLLDIGCGWGGLAMYAARNCGVEALGVTLSERQAAYAEAEIARAGLAGQVRVNLQDYRDLGAESFDKMVSVGMFEHVGRSHLPEYFAQAYRLLKPGGLFLNHGISRRAAGPYDAAGNGAAQRRRPGRWQGFLQRSLLGSGSFAQRYVFPDGELMPVSEVNGLAEAAGFEVRDVENLREHYALTLRHWVKRLEARRAEAVQAAGEVTYRTWRLYMSASAHGFSAGNLNVNQTLLAKPAPGGRSGLPLTRADLYAQG